MAMENPPRMDDVPGFSYKNGGFSSAMLDCRSVHDSILLILPKNTIELESPDRVLHPPVCHFSPASLVRISRPPPVANLGETGEAVVNQGSV